MSGTAASRHRELRGPTNRTSNQRNQRNRRMALSSARASQASSGRISRLFLFLIFFLRIVFGSQSVSQSSAAPSIGQRW